MTKCPTCGSEVRVVGDVTKHYEAIYTETKIQYFILVARINELTRYGDRGSKYQNRLTQLKQKLGEIDDNT